MTFSMRRFQAIIQKEGKDSLRNPQILLMTAMPIMFAFLFSRMGTPDRGDEQSMLLLSFPILMALSMTGAFVLAMMVAEEKEKHTLRVLMLSPASTSEILMGKSFLTAVLTLVAVAASIVLSEVPGVINWPVLILLTLISMIMFIAIGLIIGLLSRTVQESSIIGLPVLLVFIMGPMFVPMMDSEILTSIVNYLPTQKFIDIMSSIGVEGSLGQATGDLLLCLAWAGASVIAAFVVYGRKRFDK
ncbi:ABC transporter permease [Neobacillus mesonae]|nr:ABC transporter permease [Neobacillus mesonae]